MSTRYEDRNSPMSRAEKTADLVAEHELAEDEAMRKHFGRGHRLDNLEVDWQNAPQRVGDQRSNQAFARALGRG